MHLNLAISRLIDSSGTHNSTSLSVSDFSKIYGLTSREADIFQALTHFMENKQIATTMNISENTLQKHLQNLFRKFGVGSKWELMKKSMNDRGLSGILCCGIPCSAVTQAGENGI